MKYKLVAFMFVMPFALAGMSFASDDQTSLATQAAPSATHAPADKQSFGKQAAPQSLGGQAGEAARELKSTAGETLSTGAVKVAESSQKVKTEVQTTVKTLQEQWGVLAKQLQEKTQQIQKQLEQQWQDFNKSFNKQQ